MTRHHARLPSTLGPALAAAALAFAVLALPAPAAAGNRQWTQLGPDGGSISSIAVDPLDLDVVYAATSTTVFRSTDGGDSWSFAGAGLGGLGPGIRTLASTERALVVGSTWDGMWRSLDDASAWQPSAAGLPSRPHVEVLVRDPHQTERLWAGTWEGLFVSTDDGSSWSPRSGDLPLRGGVYGLAIDPATGQLYARMVDELFTSTDDGESWLLVRCLGRRCGAVLVDPQNAGTLLTISGGLLRSRDAGATWEKLRAPRKVALTPLTFVGSRLFAVGRTTVRGNTIERVYFSDDQGDHWAAAVQQPEEPSITAFAAAGDTLFLGSSGRNGAGGVFRSRDGGSTWEAASSGLSPRWIETLVVHPTQPGVIVAKASDHVFISEDDGASWRVSLPAAGSQSFGVGDLLIDADVPARIWSGDGVYLLRSDDLGRRWTQVRRVGTGVATVEADPRTPAGIWVGTSTAIYQSPDGRSWKRLRLSTAETVGVLDVAAHPAEPQVVWVAGYGYIPGGAPLGARLYRSVDGGRSWQRRDDGLPGWGVYGVVLDPQRTDVLFAASGDGIFRSRDGGASWQRLPSPAPTSGDPDGIRWEIAASPETPATLYATLAGSEAVYRSRDEGDTWQRVGANSGEAGAGSIPALVVDPHDTRRLLIGTAKRGILTWTDAAP